MKVPTLQRYTYTFAILNVLLLLASVFVAIVVNGWRSLLSEPVLPNAMIYLRLVTSGPLVDAGFIFSAAGVITVLVGVWTLVTSPTKESARTRPVGVYLLVLLHTFLITMVIATLIWFRTLRERRLYTPVWINLELENKLFIQDDLKCCGWFNETREGLFFDDLVEGFCTNLTSIKRDPDPNVVLGCIDKFDSKADDILNITFTSLYGFTVIQFSLLLVGACIANLRIQQKRFLAIDYKLRARGKGGFV